MIPIFFKRTGGGIGVHITVDADYDAVSDILTRLSMTSVKVILNVGVRGSTQKCYLLIRAVTQLLAIRRTDPAPPNGPQYWKGPLASSCTPGRSESSELLEGAYNLDCMLVTNAF